MLGIDVFEGDVLLISTPDGGDIQISDGLVLADRKFSTAVYLSLFGGNKDDDGKVKNKRTWWGNLIEGTKESEKMVSRFQNIITGLPLSTKNIRLAEQAAVLDLEWMKNEGICDEIIITSNMQNKNIFMVSIQLLKDKALISETAFQAQWGDL